MELIVKSFTPKDAIKAQQHRKGDKFYNSYTCLVPNSKYKQEPHEKLLKELIEVRLYWAPSRVYCCVWIFDKKNSQYASGSDWAMYMSEAVDSALRAAGVELAHPDNSLAGQNIESALAAIAQHLGYTDYYIHEAHG